MIKTIEKTFWYNDDDYIDAYLTNEEVEKNLGGDQTMKILKFIVIGIICIVMLPVIILLSPLLLLKK